METIQQLIKEVQTISIDLIAFTLLLSLFLKVARAELKEHWLPREMQFKKPRRIKRSSAETKRSNFVTTPGFPPCKWFAFLLAAFHRLPNSGRGRSNLRSKNSPRSRRSRCSP